MLNGAVHYFTLIETGRGNYVADKSSSNNKFQTDNNYLHKFVMSFDSFVDETKWVDGVAFELNMGLSFFERFARC